MEIEATNFTPRLRHAQFRKEVRASGCNALHTLALTTSPFRACFIVLTNSRRQHMELEHSLLSSSHSISFYEYSQEIATGHDRGYRL